MQNSIHYKFIISPISAILEDAVRACSTIGIGIDTKPLEEYIMQSTFLKMTGASEQKLKCICWEMATYDFTYRYDLLRKPIGECSNFEEKKRISKDCIDVIHRLDSNCDVFQNLDKQNLLNSLHEEIQSTFENSIIIEWQKRSWLHFCNNPKDLIEDNLFLNKNKEGIYSLFEKKLKDYYDNVVYKQRNRIAHNLKSYQENLPTLDTLSNPDFVKNSYYNMFYVLVLLDAIFVQLFKQYHELRIKSI